MQDTSNLWINAMLKAPSQVAFAYIECLEENRSYSWIDGQTSYIA